MTPADLLTTCCQQFNNLWTACGRTCGRPVDEPAERVPSRSSTGQQVPAVLVPHAGDIADLLTSLPNGRSVSNFPAGQNLLSQQPASSTSKYTLNWSHQTTQETHQKGTQK